VLQMQERRQLQVQQGLRTDPLRTLPALQPLGGRLLAGALDISSDPKASADCVA
jgi:hypothetical protein